MKIFPTSSINTKGHHLVGFQWPFRSALVEMHEEGFSCTCKKNPIKPCNHIKNVKMRLNGVFEEKYAIG